MRRSGLLGIGFIIATILILSVCSDVSHAAGAADWNHAPISINSGNVGYRSDIALDPQRKAHVGYHAGSGSLMYANNSSGTWVNESPSNVSGDYTSIAVDASGKVFISYNNAGNGYVASGNAGSWNFDTVYLSPSYNITEGTSIAVDSGGNVHVVYYDSGFLRYATGVTGPSGFWNPYDVDSDGVGNVNSLALDSKKNVHVSYYDPVNKRLKYAMGVQGPSGPTWDIRTIDISADDTGSYNSIAVDAKDNVHISYYDYDPVSGSRHLKYAKGITGGSGGTIWVADTVDSSSDTGKYNSIAVDANGNVHISYQDSTSGYLKYAVGVSGPSGMTWSTNTIDSTGNTGFDTAIAVDASNMVHISYRDANTTGGGIKYIYNGYDLSVTKSGAGQGFVMSTVSGINCDLSNTDCSDVYGPGSVVTLYAAPQLGSYFGGWSWPCGGGVTCQSNAPSVNIAMNQATTVTAIFTSTPPSVLAWSKTFGQGLNGASQNIDLIQLVSDGGYIGAGSAYNSVNGYDDFWVVKLNDSGVVQWQKTYEKYFDDNYSPDDDRAHSIQQTSDGGYIVAGDAQNIVDIDAWLLKLDKDGNIEWDYTYKASFGPDHAYSVQQTTDGGYIIAGSTSGISVDQDLWIMKLDGSGSPVWSKTYSTFGMDEARQVKQTSDGGYIVIGKNGSGVGTDIWIMKLDGKGNYEWQQVFGGGSSILDEGYSVAQTRNGEYIAAGMESGQFWAARLYNDGTVRWEKTFGTSGSAHSIRETQAGNIVVAGQDNSNMWVMVLTPDGNLGAGSWQKTYQIGAVATDASSIQRTSDGGFILSAGYIEGEDHHVLLMKLDLNGDIPGCGGVTITPTSDAGNDIFEDGAPTFIDWSSDFGIGRYLLYNGTTAASIPNAYACGAHISLDTPSPYNFGSVFTGTSAARTFTITNTGDSALILGQIADINPLAAPFSIDNDNCSGHTIQPLGNCTFRSNFLPSATGTFNDTFDIPSNSPAGPLTVSLQGTGVVQTYLLNLMKSGTGTGTVTSTETPIPKINCGSACSASYTAGSLVTLNAAASSNSAFTGWSGAGCSGTGPCTFVMNTSNSVAAGFTRTTFTVTPVFDQNGTMNPSTPQQVNSGETISFTVTPNRGYSISSAVGSCGGTLSENVYTTNSVTADCDVRISFARITLRVTASAGQGGSISPTSAAVNYGDTAQFTVTPDDGYHIASVMGCGVTKYEGGVIAAKKKKKNVKGSAAGEVYITGTVTADCTVSATFAKNTYMVSTDAGQGGGVSPTSAAVNYGETLQLTVTPDDGYHTASVMGCGVTKYEGGVIAAKKKKKVKSSAAGEVYVTGPVTEDCTVSATFAINTFTVTPIAGEHGSMNPSTPQTVNYNGTASFDIAAGEGYHIESVSGCGGTAYTAIAKKKKKKKLAAVSEMTYATGKVTGDCSVTASFAIDRFTVTAKAGDHGSIDPSGAQTVNYHDTVSFAVTPDKGYHIASTSGCGVQLSEGNIYTTDPVTGDCTVEAAFAKDIFTATVLKSGNGNGTIAGSGMICDGDICTGSYETGSKLTLKIKPDSGFKIIDVKINGKSIGAVQTITLKEIISNFTIEIIFGPV